MRPNRAGIAIVVRSSRLEGFAVESAGATLVAQYVGGSDSGHVAFYLNGSTSAATTYTIGLRQTGTPTGGRPPGGYVNTQLCRAYAVEAIEVLAQ